VIPFNLNLLSETSVLSLANFAIQGVVLIQIEENCRLGGRKKNKTAVKKKV